MHSGEVTIDNITKIEGSAGLKVIIEDDAVKDLKFILQDYRRFYTQAVKGKPIIAAPSFLSRICGTCSVAHLFASIKALEMSQGIEVSEQTKILRRLAYDGLMIRDHALHIYFFVLPDLLGVDSILDIPDDDNDAGHILLHDSFDIKRLGTDITNVIIGAAVHAPIPTVGGFLKNPDPAKFPDLVTRLEAIRPQVLRGIKTFAEWPESLVRNSDYLYLRNDNQYDYLEGDIVSSSGRRLTSDKFLEFMQEVVIPYSQSEGYKFSDTHEDYLVGALPRVNFNKDLLHPRTKADAASYLSLFPSQNIHHNNLAQAIEILHAVDDSIEILSHTKFNPEPIIKKPYKTSVGIGVIEAPRGTLYHKVELGADGVVTGGEIVVPTGQNQINIEEDIYTLVNSLLPKASKDEIADEIEKLIRAYDPCMSCASHFLKVDWDEA